ncbi:MAG: hypothetical protein EA422_16135 [Gemmatimonadales bacterium]|nr:MAG: hypothetical protein EA422_16135 [Gemmatimonadales bacterium]
MLKIYLAGLVILAGAIGLNVMARGMGLVGWYEFLSRLQEDGAAGLGATRIRDYLWLLAGYPFCLGLLGFLGLRLGNLISGP